jgi:hypothetical protein
VSHFSAEWLALREPYDLAARNPNVLDAVAASFKSHPAMRIRDLACGSGSTFRALHRRLPGAQHWDLVDSDPDLLALACNGRLDKHATLNAVRLDLSGNLETALGASIDLITISALLDLVSQPWLDRFLHEIGARALPVYAALTYDGRIDLSPADPFDAAIISAVNAHQRTDKGFGPALGPSAAGSAITGFESIGYSVISGHSDWIINSDDRVMQAELLDGWACAAQVMGTLSETDITDWRSRRRTAVAAGLSSMRVGHVDIFARPSPTR